MKKISAFILTAFILFSTCFSVSAVGELGTTVSTPEIPYISYTYWKDINTSEKEEVYSKPMYSVDRFVRSSQIGGSHESVLSDVAAFKECIYILDSGLGKIYILDKKYNYFKTVQNISYNGEKLNFIGAQGIFVDGDGLIYIADTENARVIVTDINSKAKELLLLPESSLIPSGFKFKPVKVAVDKKGYKYIASDGSYYGAILYSPKMEFLGFFGANTVKGSATTALNNFFNKIFSNDIKRAADTLSLPFTFTDITVGPDDFIYTVTGKTSTDGSIQTGQVGVYNPGGKDVLNASDINFTDFDTGMVQGKKQIQDFISITTDSNGFIYLLEKAYGRIFLYDSACNLLSAFGGSLGKGYQNGTFNTASALVLNGSDIVVTDSGKNGITIFKITDYGALVKQADIITLTGDFASGLALWQAALKQDCNNQLAYRGIAKALYDIGENNEAIKYAKMGYDRETYGKAFKNVRNEWIENNFSMICIMVLLIVAVITAFIIIKKRKKIMILKTPRTKTLALCAFHPFDCFGEIKEKKAGSVVSAFILLIAFYVTTVLNDTVGGFIFTVFDSESYNSFYVLLSTVGLVILWTVANWLVCTLMGGIGKLKEIFIVTCYSLIPLIFAYALELILTHVLVEDEAAFMGIMVYAFVLYAAFMLAVGIMKIHDYEFGKFLGTTILTVVSMMIMIFLGFLVVMLVQQIYGWILTVYGELKY